MYIIICETDRQSRFDASERVLKDVPWCTGMTQRDGIGREVRGGFRIGNICTTSMADSCECTAKTTTIL